MPWWLEESEPQNIPPQVVMDSDLVVIKSHITKTKKTTLKQKTFRTIYFPIWLFAVSMAKIQGG